MKKILNLTVIKLFVLMLCHISLNSCNSNSDRDICIKHVKTLFPNSKIYYDVNSHYIFHIVDSSGNKKVTYEKLSIKNNISELW